MAMPPHVRKLMLTAHVTCSVGWLGAVGCFLALALAGLSSQEAQTVRGAYIAMALTGWAVVVPLSIASVLTGLVQALGTPWGLMRHYWVLFKFLLSVFAATVLLLHMQPTSRVATVAAKTALSGSELHEVRIQLAADAGAALVILLVTTVLGMYKPAGLTRYGWRKQLGQDQAPRP